jgi:hypothetical protein
MDSPEQFKKTIHNYYKNIVNDEFPENIMEGVVKKLTDKYYEQYSNFKKEHPPSAKRYSTFHVKDLNHPQTFELIIEYLKTNAKSDYKKYAGQLLILKESEIIKFEQSRKDFYNMF